MESESGIVSASRRSPYFSLANPALLKPLLEAIAHASTTHSPRHKPKHINCRSLNDIFGIVSKMSEDNQVAFLMAVLKNGSFEPDWKATAQDLGTMNGHNVEEDTIRYLLAVIKSCATFEPDFSQVAGEFEIRTSRPGIDAQRRFKSIVEKAGFKLENGKQVTGGPPADQQSSNNTPTVKTPRKKAEPATKRRKANSGKVVKPKAEPEDEDGQDDQNGNDDGDGEGGAAAETA